MITFFTDPYNDEAISGVYARYHFYNGNYKKEYTLKELVGNGNTSTVKIFPSRLDYLQNQLNNKNYTADYFIYRHTIFPIYSPFVSKETQNKVIKYMKTCGNDKIYIIFSIAQSRLKNIGHYRYCPVCAKEDFEKYGEAYFHRSYQFGGMLICEKHKCKLNDYPIKQNEEGAFIYFHYSIVKDRKIRFYKDSVTKFLNRVSNSIKDIMNLPYLKYNREIIMEKYRDILCDKGYTTPKGLIKQRKLSNDFRQYYGKELLELLDSEIDESAKNNWMRVLFLSSNKFIHPIRHILLIIFLAGDIESFLKYKKKIQTFGKGPWPCLNLVCVQYKKRIIEKYDIQQVHKSTLLNGIFKCTFCGYTYKRKSQDMHGGDVYIKDKVIDYGKVWEDEFLKLLEEKKGIYYIARRMGVKYEFVKYYIDNKKFKPKPIYGVELKKNNFKKYTEDIVRYLRKNPNCLRSDIKRDLEKQYAWIQRNDKEWLNNNLPKPVKSRGGCLKKYNLMEKDEYILGKIKIKYEDIMNEKTPKRISITAIEKRIKARINSKIDELPRCKEYLSKIIETIHQFRIRRLKIYLSSGENVKDKKTRSKILSDTSIHICKLTKEEKVEIEEIIIEYINNFIDAT